ncbi:hypothetical protein [Desulfosporosinus sp. OT]|uniref:hypothetical protein n=1 Tax=Desulfosporosinus sp. OT TaxID=913865 RepID=UPI0011125A6D|nr:hypothetical protein [Desulfosporosinus sp. OT]
MTQRSVPTTQSKLTVQAPGYGERGSSYAGKYSFRDRGFGDINPTPVGIPLGITASAIVSTGDYRHWRLSCQKRHPLARRHCLRTY